jgi:hypothetical protein
MHAAHLARKTGYKTSHSIEKYIVFMDIRHVAHACTDTGSCFQSRSVSQSVFLMYAFVFYMRAVHFAQKTGHQTSYSIEKNICLMIHMTCTKGSLATHLYTG